MKIKKKNKTHKNILYLVIELNIISIYHELKLIHFPKTVIL